MAGKIKITDKQAKRLRETFFDIKNSSEFLFNEYMSDSGVEDVVIYNYLALIHNKIQKLIKNELQKKSS